MVRCISHNKKLCFLVILALSICLTSSLTLEEQMQELKGNYVSRTPILQPSDVPFLSNIGQPFGRTNERWLHIYKIELSCKISQQNVANYRGDA